MKTSLLSLSIIFILFLSGCKKNPVNPQSVTSIVHKINNNRPYASVFIEIGSNWTTYNISDYQKAYAENGYFIIVLKSNNKSYYNLERVKEVNISNGDLYLYY